jgi:hypothetical protein
VKRDLKDWCITKELALDRREWKLAIHVSKPWSLVPSFLLSSVKVFFLFFCPFHFFFLAFYCLFSFCRIGFCFYRPSFSLFFRHCFILVSLTHVVSSLAYPNLLGLKCLIVVVVFLVPFLRRWDLSVLKIEGEISCSIWRLIINTLELILWVCALCFHIWNEKKSYERSTCMWVNMHAALSMYLYWSN